MESHLNKGNCTKKEAEISLSQMYIFDIPHFLYNLENSKKFSHRKTYLCYPAFIYVGHYLKEFYSKFENILTDSSSLIQILEISIFDIECFYSQ